MDFSPATLSFYGVGAAAVATSVATLRKRLELSRAKHRSLSGHARIARRLARLLPFYEYGEERFFCSDGAPADIAARRRDDQQDVKRQRHQPAWNGDPSEPAERIDVAARRRAPGGCSNCLRNGSHAAVREIGDGAREDRHAQLLKSMRPRHFGQHE